MRNLCIQIVNTIQSRLYLKMFLFSHVEDLQKTYKLIKKKKICQLVDARTNSFQYSQNIASDFTDYA